MTTLNPLAALAIAAPHRNCYTNVKLDAGQADGAGAPFGEYSGAVV